MPDTDVTGLLAAASRGDTDAMDQLFPVVYGKLKLLARTHLRGERGDHTLSATALVHEAFLRLVDQTSVTWARPTERVGNDRTGGAITIDHTNPTFTVSGRLNFVWENEILDKVGRTTGWTYGAVEDTCTDFSSGREGEPKWKKLCSDRVDFAINDGDSGSPVFYWKTDGTAELRGIVFAWQGCPFPIGWCYNDAIMSNLHQVELDLGALSLHGVIARIDGPSIVLPNENYTWNAIVTGGKAPFSFSWYRDGALVSTASAYTGNSESSDFELRLDVSDALGGQSSSTLFVQVWTNPCPPPQLVC